VGKGSARSVPGFDLYQGLSSCAHLLASFGGHSAAAGLRIDPDRIDPFMTAFEETVRKYVIPDESGTSDAADCILAIDNVTPELLNALETLQPFGQGNPEPLFMARNVRIRSQRVVGQNHRQMHLHQHDTRTIPAIQFNFGPTLSANDAFEHITFHLRWNRWNGNKTPQMIIRETKVK
jgi:single-stranded-DNA-specific exonuclease